MFSYALWFFGSRNRYARLSLKSCCLLVFTTMDLFENSLALKRAWQRDWIQVQRRYAKMKFSHWCLQTAMCIVLHFNYDFTHPVLWLRSKKRRGARLEADADEESLRNDLEDFLLSSNVDVLTSWIDPQHTPLLPSCLKTAAEFAKNSNHDRSFQRVLARAGRFRISSGRRWSIRSRARMWDMRWRRRFGGRYRSLCVEEPVALDEKREKAWHQKWNGIDITFYSRVRPIWGSKMEPLFGTSFGPHTCACDWRGTNMEAIWGILFWLPNWSHF